METISLTDLAGDSARLADTLLSLQERCNHESTSSEISNIADELVRLSTTAWHLHEAMNAETRRYTKAFNEDLNEINTELRLVLDEISQCCVEMQKADSELSPVPWFFKKGRVTRLTKHLETLKGTLAVMRTVLWHGKVYGAEFSGSRLVNSASHSMYEDKIILESVLSRNRNAIADLQKLELSPVNERIVFGSGTTSSGDARSCDGTDRVEIPPVPDIALSSETKSRDSENGSQDRLSRTFSKRGVRLGVHKFILGFNTQDAPDSLKRKWIEQQRSSLESHNTAALEPRSLDASPKLSKITEMGANESTEAKLEHPTTDTSMAVVRTSHPYDNDNSSETPTPSSKLPPSSQEKSSVTKGFMRSVRRMSLANFRSSQSTHDVENENIPHHQAMRESEDGRADGQTEHNGKVFEPNNCNSTQNDKEASILKMLTRRFQRSPLSTPDVEREFENGLLH